MQHARWLVAACAAAGISRNMALSKQALLLQLDPLAAVAIQMQGQQVLPEAGGLQLV